MKISLKETYGNVAARLRPFQLLRTICFDNTQVELNSSGVQLSVERAVKKGTHRGYSLPLLTGGFAQCLERVVDGEFVDHSNKPLAFLVPPDRGCADTVRVISSPLLHGFVSLRVSKSECYVSHAGGTGSRAPVQHRDVHRA